MSIIKSDKISKKLKNKDWGWDYPRMVKEYFGDMYLCLKETKIEYFRFHREKAEIECAKWNLCTAFTSPILHGSRKKN